jgi:hypothetical protein
MEDIAVQVGNYTTAFASNSLNIVGNFIILGALTLLFLVVSYRSRSGMNIIALTLSFYIAYALYLVFPYTKEIVGAGGSPDVKAIISVGIFLLGCIPGYLFVHRLISGGIGLISVFPRLGLSFLCAAFLVALAYHTFSIDHIYTFPEPMNSLFAPDQYFFWWFVAPLIGLLLLVH